MRVELTRYRPDLHEEAAALHAPLCGGEPGLSSSYLSWKYTRNPFIGEPLLYLAVAGGRVVGMRGAYGTCWEAADDVRLCLPCLSDTVIDGAHRDRGLVASLTRFALDDLRARGYGYALNLSATPVTTLAALAGGWRGVGRPTTLRRRSRPEIARRELSGRARPGAGVAHTPFARFDRASRSDEPAPAQGRRAGAHDPRVLRHVRDDAYRAWRFGDPRVAYRHVRDGEAGYVTLAGFPGEQHVSVADWEAEPPALARLLRSALARGRFGTVVLRAAGLDAATETAFRETGFADWREAGADVCAALLLRPTSEETRAGTRWELAGLDLLDPATWELRQLDSDLV